jgi:hypothetical protein
MPLLDIQRKGQQIGRIRIGIKVKPDHGQERPTRLSTFRLTTGSRYSADAIVDVLGGEVRPWEGQWEVITERSELVVTIPPRDQVITQWYEMWNRGGCLRRCDSQREQISGKPCLCPADPVERSVLAKQNPPVACKNVTRINVMVPDLPGFGVWRLDTGSYYAAVELGDSAALMEAARDAGVFLPAILRIDQRTRVAGGKTTHYPVPVLEVTATFRQVVSGELAAAGMVAQLPPATEPVHRALTATPATAPAPAPAAASPTVAPATAPPTAQELAEMAAAAVSRAEVEQLVALAKEHLLTEEHVLVDPATETYDQLAEVLRERWKELPRPVVTTDEEEPAPDDGYTR